MSCYIIWSHVNVIIKELIDKYIKIIEHKHYYVRPTSHCLLILICGCTWSRNGMFSSANKSKKLRNGVCVTVTCHIFTMMLSIMRVSQHEYETTTILQMW